MLTPTTIIQKKRDGGELTRDEIKFFVNGVTTGEFADYQSTALLMAIFFRGMTLKETVSLTEAMIESGEKYDLSAISGAKIDKHSTGGVGDKVSIILAPLAAACGLKVPMMSGRGLGHSGGTLDKLESIAGFDVRLSRERFEQVLRGVGCAMIGQSEKIAPADKKLYALRDVTGTVECIPLIVASILSKKIAEGAEGLVLDVKCGSGAFMKTRKEAQNLAKALMQVGTNLGLKMRAVVSNMDQPLGYAAGNALEIRESIEVLRGVETSGQDSSDLKKLTLELCAEMLLCGQKVKSYREGLALAEVKLKDGSAWRVFEKLVEAQRGSLDRIRNPEMLTLAPNQGIFYASRTGWITAMNTEALGRIVVELGGGRKKASDSIDPAVGLVFHKKIGNLVKKGERLVTLYTQTIDQATALEPELARAITISGKATPTQKRVPKLVFEKYD
ncbi:MAG: thymidine phosphorylase [Bdellovibrionota bacterium]